MDSNFDVFPDEEYAARLARAREQMKAKEWDAMVLSAPENVYYLTGLNHQGYFGLHLLIVPLEGDIHLIARGMERVTMEHQLTSRVTFDGHPDSQKAVDRAAEIIKELGLEKSTIAMDMGAMYRSYSDTKQLFDDLPGVTWADSQYFMHELRFVKSPLEIAAMRRAGTISDRMMEAIIRTAAPGVNEKAIAAEVYKEMILADGESPSFAPFIRPASRGGEEHTTWSNQPLRDKTLFVELSGSYQRYHAPMGRYIYIDPPKQELPVQKVCREAFEAVASAMKPGVKAREVYAVWQKVVDDAGLPEYRRHHCGYMVGLSFPPAWAECGNRDFNLSDTSDLELQAGMTFHVLSWLVGSKLGDDFISNTVLVTDKGGEVLTTTSQNTLTTTA